MATTTFEEIVSYCKRKGFVYPSSEIYGGFAAVYDYGPYGVELLNNVKNFWWKEMVQKRQDILGLDSAIFTHPRVWEASGHVGGFSDPLAECKKCHTRIRVDHVVEGLGVVCDEKMSEDEIRNLFDQNKEKIKCPKCGSKDFSEPKKFNLLVKSNLGDFTGNDSEPVYLRGETCQGIYINFKNVVDTTRAKIPFGIAQIGKAFRNEITARQFIFRTREFEQMEMQYFTKPSEDMKEYEKLKKERWNYYIKMGFKEENLKWHKHENLVFYAKEAYDIEYKFPFGFKEIEGLHARTNYDLSQHTKFSGEDLSYRDPITNEKYIPHVIEASSGVARVFLAVLCEFYNEDEIEGEKRIVLKFPFKLAPIKFAVFPLIKKEENQVNIAQKIFEELSDDFMCEYDDTGSIGKRYRRQDEIGTPYCITVDHESINDNSVTIRDRDTLEQIRLPIDQIKDWVNEKLK